MFQKRTPNLEIRPSVFQDKLDSSILVRERARGSKLEGTFKKKSGKVVSESAHTITMILEKSNAPKVYSKRDVAAATDEQKEIMEKKKTIDERHWPKQLARVTARCNQKGEKFKRRKGRAMLQR